MRGADEARGSIAVDGCRRAWSIRKALIVSMTIALCVVGILAGCQPKAPSGSTQEGASSEQQNVSEGSSGSSMPGDFKVADAGVWSDTQYAQSMNAGNRGCNACHASIGPRERACPRR